MSALEEGAQRILGRPLSADETARFDRYLDLLLDWQRVHRLVGSADRAWIVDRLFLDSLLFTRVLPCPSVRLLDLGAGAGFPGIPLKIVTPGLSLTLVESRRRRASFLATVIRDLALTDAAVIDERAEAIDAGRAGTFDAVVMRCAGDFARLLPVALRLAHPAGVVVASGPPKPRPLPRGEWVSVPGVRSDETRFFAVVRQS